MRKVKSFQFISLIISKLTPFCNNSTCIKAKNSGQIQEMKGKARRNFYQEIQTKESGNGIPLPNSPPSSPPAKDSTVLPSRQCLYLSYTHTHTHTHTHTQVQWENCSPIKPFYKHLIHSTHTFPFSIFSSVLTSLVYSNDLVEIINKYHKAIQIARIWKVNNSRGKKH